MGKYLGHTNVWRWQRITWAWTKLQMNQRHWAVVKWFSKTKSFPPWFKQKRNLSIFRMLRGNFYVAVEKCAGVVMKYLRPCHNGTKSRRLIGHLSQSLLEKSVCTKDSHVQGRKREARPHESESSFLLGLQVITQGPFISPSHHYCAQDHLCTIQKNHSQPWKDFNWWQYLIFYGHLLGWHWLQKMLIWGNMLLPVFVIVSRLWCGFVCVGFLVLRGFF